ncbi:MAG: hypothetical protein KUG77_08820 [Nannocystaceae bacterium]|nr:hypothetical protein [Nannocystaceae bacterium]
MDVETSVLVEESDLAIYCWHNVVLRLGSRAPDAEQVLLLHTTLETLLESHSSVGLMAWLPQRARLPSGPTRARAGNMIRSLAPGLAGLSIVVDSTGFWANAVRRVVTGLTLFAPLPMKVTTEAGDASMWLSDRLKLGNAAGQALGAFGRSRTDRVNDVAS